MKPSFNKQYVVNELNDSNIKYSIEESYLGSQFHTIIKDNFTFFIEEFSDEILCSIFMDKKQINPILQGKTKEEIFSKIKNLIP